MRYLRAEMHAWMLRQQGPVRARDIASALGLKSRSVHCALCKMHKAGSVALHGKASAAKWTAIKIKVADMRGKTEGSKDALLDANAKRVVRRTPFPACALDQHWPSSVYRVDMGRDD
jgi:hypothetical protein